MAHCLCKTGQCLELGLLITPAYQPLVLKMSLISYVLNTTQIAADRLMHLLVTPNRVRSGAQMSAMVLFGGGQVSDGQISGRGGANVQSREAKCLSGARQ